MSVRMACESLERQMRRAGSREDSERMPSVLFSSAREARHARIDAVATVSALDALDATVAVGQVLQSPCGSLPHAARRAGVTMLVRHWFVMLSGR